MKLFLILLLVLGAGPAYVALFGNIALGRDWRTADRRSTGIAPDPGAVTEAIVQVYAARAFNWRGAFAVHTWLATKPKAADRFDVHEVIGWRETSDSPVVVSGPGIADRSWYGNDPVVLCDVRGDVAAGLIPAIEHAVRSYPYARSYALWPGPNSNTFTAWVLRRVPELEAELPTTAIGKDYLANGSIVDIAPSGTGYQLSLLGVLGVLAAKYEGLEINFLGLSFGLDPLRPALKLPGVGRIGMRSATRLVSSGRE